MKIEREVKLAAWGGFAVPPLDDVAPDVSAAPLKTKKLDATYYDTRDLRLARAGVSLRHRVGDDPPWTVKLPEGEAGPVMSRREFPFAGPAGAVPAEAAALVRAYARSEALAPVARLKTERARVGLSFDGAQVAEIADDEVSVYHGRRLASRFREVEVEVEDAAPDGLLEAVVGRLRDAGAGEPDTTPRTCTRPASAPAGCVPTCARSARCSTRNGCRGCGRRRAGTPGCWARCATSRC